MNNPVTIKKNNESANDAITRYFNHPEPHFAFCMGGVRRLSVNPRDNRARKMLLAKGPLYFSKNQLLIYTILKNLPIDIFFDIGVNYGECLFSAPFFCQIKSRGFEANPELITYLKKSLKMNDDLLNIQFINKAVCESLHDKISFFVDESWSGKSSAIEGVTGKNTKRIEVETTTIDYEISEEAKKPDFLLLKIDVEGLEPSVLFGAEETTKNVDNIICLMEFDSRYLKAGGVADAENFFNYIRDRFVIRLYSHQGFAILDSFDELQASFSNGEFIHCDLVLTKLSNRKLSSACERLVLSRTMKEMRSRIYS